MNHHFHLQTDDVYVGGIKTAGTNSPVEEYLFITEEGTTITTSLTRRLSSKRKAEGMMEISFQLV